MNEDAREIELALRATPAAAERLLASLALAGLPCRRMHLVSRYFDTPALRLRQAGAVLRVRQDGRRVVQTLKTAPRAGEPAIARGEWSRRPRGRMPVLDGPAERAALAGIGIDVDGLDGLQEIFVTDFERVAVEVAHGASRMEVAVDRGEIRAGGRSAPLCDVEIELLSGDVADVHALALRLLAAEPMALQPLPKSARAHALLSGQPPAALRAERTRLDRRVAVGPALRDILRACSVQLRANAAAIEAGDDPLAVHQFRVALRRMRSAFAAFAGAMPVAERRRFSASLRRIARRSDAARELDVFVGEMLPALRRRMGDGAVLAPLDALAGRARHAARETLRMSLRDARFAATVLRLEAWVEGDGWRAAAGALFDQPARGYARDMLRRLHRKLLREGRDLGALDPGALHRVRLRAKKLRYAAEFFRDLFPGSGAGSWLRALARVQDRLGVVNDGVSVRALLQRLERINRADRQGVAQATAVVLGWCAAREAAELDELPETWKAFLARRQFWS